MHLKFNGARVPVYHFGVRIPTNVKNAYELDAINKNQKWSDAISKEIQELQDFDTFRVLRQGEKIPEGYKFVPMHMVFDVKHDGRHKARYVMSGSQTDPAIDDVFSPVVGLDTVRLILFIAAHNGLAVRMADVTCAFLQAKTKEKVYTRAGIEWGDDLVGSILILIQSIYGLKTSGARWYELLAEVLLDLGFKPSRAGVSIWMRLNENGTYDFICVYVDDLLVAALEPIPIIEAIRKLFDLKGEGFPDYYLGGNIERCQVDYTPSRERLLRLELLLLLWV